MAVDLASLATAAGALLAGVAAWQQSRRASLSASLDRVDRELSHERRQRQLLARAYVEQRRWIAAHTDPEGDQPPEPPEDLELLPWQ